MAEAVEIDVEGRHLRLSNLDKMMYPVPGFTKAQVIDYYSRVAPALLPHLRDRALTLKRYPDGVSGEFFYEKQCPRHRPVWMRTASVYSSRNGAEVNYCVVDDLPSLVWAANLASLELHTSLARAGNVLRPCFLVFDLDPGAPATIVECCRVGLWVREIFEGLGLRCFPKTSGSKGLQVYIPLNTEVSYDVTKPLALTIAQHLEHDHGDLVVSAMSKALRPGKVFVDWSQNDDHKTTVCVYSLRARERPTVSTPLSWEEVERCAAGKMGDHLLVFEAEAVLERVERQGDLFAPVLELVQDLAGLL
ncbi:MAG: non-homologous end-joining DNA ligase [Candidatus Dormibacteria bacterium]